MQNRDWASAEELGTDVLNVENVGARATAGATGGALNADELRLLEAISARILPTTDTPGAVEAGAANYVDIALAGAYADLLPRYQQGLRELQAHCQSQRGAAFESLPDAQQDEVLEALQAGNIAEVKGGDELFALVRRHILEGVFCEPTYGGNRDLVGWALVGFPGQRYGYADPYINKVIDLPPVAVEGVPSPDDPAMRAPGRNDA
jgi:gluconate 2-dehydrogenase gamma chain